MARRPPRDDAVNLRDRGCLIRRQIPSRCLVRRCRPLSGERWRLLRPSSFVFLGSYAEHDHTAPQLAVATFGVCVVASWGATEASRIAFSARGYHLGSTVETDVEKPTPAAPKSAVANDGVANHLEAQRAGPEFAAALAVIYLGDRTTLGKERSGPQYRNPQVFGSWGS